MFQQIETLFATVIGLLAMALAGIGVYGLVAFSTQLRTHEIGVRMALGAQRNRVLWMVMEQGLRLAVIGLGLGIVLSTVLVQLLRGLFYGVSTRDPFTITCVIALLAIIAVLASYLPARRALHVNPMQSTELPNDSAVLSEQSNAFGRDEAQFLTIN